MPGEMTEEVAKFWWLPLITGIAWLIVALVVLRFNEASVTTVGIIAGLVFIGAGLNDLAMSRVVDRWKALWAVLGLDHRRRRRPLLPWNTFEALAAIIGWFLLFKGTFDISIALADRRTRPVVGGPRDRDRRDPARVLGRGLLRAQGSAADHLCRGQPTLARGVMQITIAFRMRALTRV